MELRVDIKGVEQAIAAAKVVGEPKAKLWMQQAVNRAGVAEKGLLAKDIQAALPVKLKYIRSRLVWRNMDRAGKGGRLRIYGSGSGQSAFIRPRNMKPSYSTDPRPKREIGPLSKRQMRVSRKLAAVTYGVGGSMPEAARRAVLGGFFVSVQAGPTFTQSGSPGFERNKAQLFQRTGQSRLPIENQRGVTVGMVAHRLKLAAVSEKRMSERALKEFAARVEREILATVAKR